MSWRKGYDGEKNKLRVCLICGKEYLVNKYEKKRYCSPECRKKSQKDKWKRYPHPRGMLGKKHKPETLEKYKNRVAWNKGLTKETDERVKKYGISQSKTKKILFAQGELIPHCKNKTKEIYTPLQEISKKLKGHIVSEITRKKISISHKGKLIGEDNPSKRPEVRKKISKGIRNSEKWRKAMKELRKNPEFIKKILSSLLKRPTSFEQKISDLCFKHNLPFVYRGNGSFLINFKNPDFVDEKDKIVIEVFYSWFKIRDYGSVENYKEFCRRKYEPAGWKVIFLDELDIQSENWEEICLNKIKSFFNSK